jgi:hypothetical protein
MPRKLITIEEGYAIADRKEKVKVLKNGKKYLEDGSLCFLLNRLNVILKEEYHSPRNRKLYLISSYPVYMMDGVPKYFVDKDPFSGHDFRRLLLR